MRKQLILIAFAFLLVLPFVSAVPPVSTVQQFTEGYIIEGTTIQYLPLGEDFNYNFFLYNISDGMPIQSSSADCFFRLADHNGNIIFYDEATKVDGYWSVTLPASNFSEVGIYPYGVRCNSTSLGGASVGAFEVTPYGNPQPLEFIVVFFIFAFIVIMFFFLEELIVNIGRFASFNLDVTDVAKSIGIYFGLLALYQMTQLYLGNIAYESWLLLFIKVGGYTHLIFPIIGLFLSMIIGSFKKKDVAFGTQKIFKGGRNGIKV